MKLSYLPDEAHWVLCWSFVSRISTHGVLVHQTFITLNCFALLPLGAFRVLSCLLDSEDSNAPSDQILIFCLCSAALESKQHNECDMCLNRMRAEHFRFRMSPVICEFLWLDQTAFLRRSIDGVLSCAVYTLCVFKAQEEASIFCESVECKSWKAGLVEFVPLINGSVRTHMDAYCTLLRTLEINQILNCMEYWRVL